MGSPRGNGTDLVYDLETLGLTSVDDSVHTGYHDAKVPVSRQCVSICSYSNITQES